MGYRDFKVGSFHFFEVSISKGLYNMQEDG